MANKKKSPFKKKTEHISYQFYYADVDNIDGEFVKNMRKNFEFTQQVFADAIGVSKKTIEKWEQGVNPIQGPTARLLYLLNDNTYLINKLYHSEITYPKQHQIIFDLDFSGYTHEVFNQKTYKPKHKFFPITNSVFDYEDTDIQCQGGNICLNNQNNLYS